MRDGGPAILPKQKTRTTDLKDAIPSNSSPSKKPPSSGNRKTLCETLISKDLFFSKQVGRETEKQKDETSNFNFMCTFYI